VSTPRAKAARVDRERRALLSALLASAFGANHVLSQPSVSASAARLTAPAPPAATPAVRLDTAEFTMLAATSEARARALCERVLVFRRGVEELLGLLIPRGLPMRVFALPTDDWMQYAAPRPGTAGAFVAHDLSADLMLDAQSDSALALELALHEYTHHLVRTLGGNSYPVFFDEGLAEVLSTATLDRRVLRITPRRDHRDVLDASEWLPFERLGQVRRTDAEYLEPARARAFYAQSWATVYFALAHRVADERRLVRFMRAIDAGDAVDAASARLAGGPSTAPNEDVRGFIARRGGPAPIEIEVPFDAAEALIDGRPVHADEYLCQIAELQLRLGRRAEQAQRLARRVLADTPHHARARAIDLAARLQSGGRDEAERALDAFDDDAQLAPEAALVLARALLQISLPSQGAPAEPDPRRRTRAERAHRLFDRAHTVPSCWLEAVNGLVLTSLALQRRDARLVSLATAARSAAPQSAELAVGLAMLLDAEDRSQDAQPHWRAAALRMRPGPGRDQVLKRLGADPSSPLPAADEGHSPDSRR
jgi:hypothetical protein